jgi:ubiquinone/menaquinone biosynthesis C-methylase UbiE
LSHDVERFNRWAATYDRHYLQRLVFEPVQETVLDLAASQVPSAAEILDVGCGTGRLLTAAEQRFPNARLAGVDAASEMIKHAQSVQPAESRINFRQAVAEQLPFPGAQFDLVLSTMTFHHWADQRQGIAEIARVLKPDGRWVLADFIAGGPMRWVFRLVRPKRFHERRKIDAMVAKAGLQVTAQRQVPGLWGQVSVLAIEKRPSQTSESGLG